MNPKLLSNQLLTNTVTACFYRDARAAFSLTPQDRHWIRSSPNQSTHAAPNVIQVGGSNLVKQQEQLGSPNVDVTSLFDFCFSENGLTAFRLGESLASNNFIQWLGEDKYQALVDFVLKFIANTKLPRKRGTFVEFRNGMVNISPVGRAASIEERDEFEAYVPMLCSTGVL